MARKVPRKEREKQQHCEEILRAAETVFAEKGYSKAKVSDIAEAAEFSVGYIYNIWRSKKELYFSVLDAKLEDFRSHIWARVERTEDLFEKINVLIDAHFSFVEKHKDFFKIYLSETSQVDMRTQSTVSRRFKRNSEVYIPLVEEIFQKGIYEGIFVSNSPHDMAIALKGLIFAFTVDCLNRSSNEGFGDKRDAMKRIFFNSVLSQTRVGPKELNTS